MRVTLMRATTLLIFSFLFSTLSFSKDQNLHIQGINSLVDEWNRTMEFLNPPDICSIEGQTIDEMMKVPDWWPACDAFMVIPTGELGEYGNIIKTALLARSKYAQDHYNTATNEEEKKEWIKADPFLSNENMPKDIEEVCPAFPKFNQNQKIAFWVRIFGSMAAKESSCDASNNEDRVTFSSTGGGRGLLQMERKLEGNRDWRVGNYAGDHELGKECLVSESEISLPENNLLCGIQILADIINGKYPKNTNGQLFDNPGTYWKQLRFPEGGEIGTLFYNLESVRPLCTLELSEPRPIADAEAQPINPSKP